MSSCSSCILHGRSCDPINTAYIGTPDFGRSPFQCLGAQAGSCPIDEEPDRWAEACQGAAVSQLFVGPTSDTLPVERMHADVQMLF